MSNPLKTIDQVREHFRHHQEPVRFEVRRGTVMSVNSIENAYALLDYMSAPAPATNEIVTFFHCSLCIKELPSGISPRDWAQLEVGWTPHGIQIWCKRHECNVAHIDFEGAQHPANLGIHQADLGLNA